MVADKTIKVDSEVKQIIGEKRKYENESYNSILRRILKLKIGGKK